MIWFMEQFLSDTSNENDYLFPLLLDDEKLIDMPPATIINALHDPLCDHGTEYFKKLKRVNVPVHHSIYGTSIHGFFGSGVGESEEAIMEVSVALTNAFQRVEKSELV